MKWVIGKFCNLVIFKLLNYQITRGGYSCITGDGSYISAKRNHLFPTCHNKNE